MFKDALFSYLIIEILEKKSDKTNFIINLESRIPLESEIFNSCKGDFFIKFGIPINQKASDCGMKAIRMII